MGCTCDEILDVAYFLLASQDEPVKENFIRSSISRAYYSAFLEARERAINLTWITENPQSDSHRLVRDAYRTRGKRGISGMLSSLFADRNKADYDLNRNIGLSKAQNALLLANKIKGDVKKCNVK